MLKKFIKFISHPKEYYPNVYILGYHLLKAFQKILIKLGFAKTDGLPTQDMFNWSLYSLHYKGELIEAKKSYTMDLKPGDYIFINSELTKNNDKIKPLYSNHRFLYETILQLNPDSVFEMGCGNGMHLNNLRVLNPGLKLSGIDLLEKQIQLLQKNYPNLRATVKQANATLPFSGKLPPADVAFTQAVIMHIHTDKLHLMALENLFKMAKKYVILMEGAKSHQFMEDIKELHSKKLIDWEKIYFYYRIDKETNRPTSIICSNETLDYPILTDYKIYFT